jgi:hypothetical protein
MFHGPKITKVMFVMYQLSICTYLELVVKYLTYQNDRFHNNGPSCIWYNRNVLRQIYIAYSFHAYTQ